MLILSENFGRDSLFSWIKIIETQISDVVWEDKQHYRIHRKIINKIDTFF